MDSSREWTLVAIALLVAVIIGIIWVFTARSESQAMEARAIRAEMQARDAMTAPEGSPRRVRDRE